MSKSFRNHILFNCPRWRYTHSSFYSLLFVDCWSQFQEMCHEQLEITENPKKCFQLLTVVTFFANVIIFMLWFITFHCPNVLKCRTISKVKYPFWKQCCKSPFIIKYSHTKSNCVQIFNIISFEYCGVSKGKVKRFRWIWFCDLCDDLFEFPTLTSIKCIKDTIITTNAFKSPGQNTFQVIYFHSNVKWWSEFIDGIYLTNNFVIPFYFGIKMKL